MSRGLRRRATDAALTGAARHWGLLVLLEVGIVLRAFVTYAYTPAFFFPDSTDYLSAAELGEPLKHRPYGYSAFLDLMDGLVPFRGVAVVQHVLGLLAVVLVYAVLVRRGVRRRWACLAVAPLALDGFILSLEHYLLAEPLFILQLAVAVALLLWRERPGWALAGGAGLVLGAAAVTRNVGVFVVAAFGAYLLVRLLVRSVRWTAVAAFAAASALVVLSYFSWFQSYYGEFSSTDYAGHFLYGRVSVFVDCDRTDVPARLQGLCPTESVEDRPHPDFYVWSADSPAQSGRWSEDDLEEFAKTAIRQQPWDFARSTLRAMALYVQPGRQLGPKDVCPQYWDFPQTIDRVQGCTADLAGLGYALEPTPTQLRSEPAAVLGAYQQRVHTPGPALAVLVLAAVAGAVRRGRPVRERLDTLVLLGVGVVLVAVPSATAVMDYRYGLPVLVVLPAAAVLGLRGATLPRRRRAPAVEVPDDPSSLLTPVPSGGTDQDVR